MEVDFKNKCRVCLLEDKQKHYLFNEFDQGVTLRDILVNTTGFEIEKDDGLSSYACRNCTTIIVEFYNLKTIYEENENQMKSLLKSSKIDNPNASASQSVSKSSNQHEQISSPEDDYITIKIESYSSENDENGDDFNPRCENSYDQDAEVNSFGDTVNVNAPTKDNDNQSEFEYQEINTFTCPECGDCFLYKNDIHAHMVSKHDITEIDYDDISELSLLKVQKNAQNSENKCKLCNKTFDCTESYRIHIETHKKNVCDICGIGFIKKSYLKDHQEVHCTEKRHVCSYCNKAFKRRTVLVKHKRIHTHPRQCICEVCGKAFNDKGTLKTHIMLIHIRERNYMCLICGVKFPLKGTLEKHIRRHQNKEREFFCDLCPLGYRDKSSLDRHIYVKHSGQNLKATCIDCGKQYTTVSNLFKHQRNCHKVAAHSSSVDENTECV